MIILPITSRLNSYIQGTSIDIRKIKRNAELAIQTLGGCRDENQFELLWVKLDLLCSEIEKLVDSEEIDFEFRKAKLPTRRPSKRHQALMGENSDGNVVHTDIKSFHRVTNFFPALDMIVSELKSRFSENEQDILCALEAVVFDENVDESAFSTVSQFYLLDQDLLQAEHKLYCHFKASLAQNSSSAEVFKKLWSSDVLTMMPEVAKAIHIYTVIPATSCTAERSFSGLRRLKTYLRSTIGQSRLSSLALLHIEREYTNKVLAEDMDKMINVFG